MPSPTEKATKVRSASHANLTAAMLDELRKFLPTPEQIRERMMLEWMARELLLLNLAPPLPQVPPSATLLNPAQPRVTLEALVQIAYDRGYRFLRIQKPELGIDRLLFVHHEHADCTCPISSLDLTAV